MLTTSSRPALVRLLTAFLLAAVLTAAPPADAGQQPSAPERTRAERVLHRMTLPQRVGQLFMVGSPATSVDAATRREIGRLHVGSVMLTGRSYAGTRRTARVVHALESRATWAATSGARLLVATDQEGGQVQVLHGPGLDEMPTALGQGGWGLAHLRGAAGRWARQLRASGVNMNLAPVLDTVPGPRAAASNEPIGRYDREFGYTPVRVSRHGLAFARGMATHGIAPSVKHFPGLGRVRGNTDTTARVVDRVTRRHDPYLEPFQHAVTAGVPFVMMSSAVYARLDRHHPAAFSGFVIRTMLRSDLGFDGVVVSDDLANARQVARWSPGVRAVKFLHAGGDLVLTVSPRVVPAMVHAVLERARHDERFRARVDSAALRVLEAKDDQGLLGR
ncbi:glycoside hydrolase family 3 N-terminal domain-containing protein [Nocardioides sp. LS1]|uniref:glycoside hydrolase family 3 N-terminal domain-containing protein n=1 Tax=Nocardioides sp. LS1 TaxID=1027620 RepID=UPI000F623E24|nr:glycoside hydrolase family 3 N-terminal domain-containing protein [Nocardioides sp. LS1]GCD89663.1 beta-N-acetylhexosaminidase [Nocardioides sp. LS1]